MAGPPGSGVIRLSLCGDVMTGRGVDQVLPHPGDPELREAYVGSALDYVALAERASGPIGHPLAFGDIWGTAHQVWRRLAPDVRLANLETAVTTADTFAPKGINYRMNPANAPCLAAAGLDVCSLANNHVLDFGPAGLAETVATLRRTGITPVGAGEDLEAARAPAVVEARGRRVLVFGVCADDSGAPSGWAARAASPGVHLLRPTTDSARELGRWIAGRRRPGDLVVVSIHWGSNWGYDVPDAHRRFAHALIDTGEVAVIHGHSSHHPRPIEVYRGRLILYGCGDLLNDYEGISGYEDFRGDLVALYFADLDPNGGELRGLHLAPLRIRRMRLSDPAPGDADWLARTLSRESAGLGVGLDLAGDGTLRASWRNSARA